MDVERAVRLAEKGLVECRRCHRVLPIREALTAWYGGAPAFAACLPCLGEGYEIVMRRVGGAIEVAVRGEADAALVVGVRSGAIVDHKAGPEVMRVVHGEED